MVPTFPSRTLSPHRHRWPIWKTSRTRARLVVPRTWDCHYQRAAALSTTGKPSRRETHCSIPCDMRNIFVPCVQVKNRNYVRRRRRPEQWAELSPSRLRGPLLPISGCATVDSHGQHVRTEAGRRHILANLSGPPSPARNLSRLTGGRPWLVSIKLRNARMSLPKHNEFQFRPTVEPKPDEELDEGKKKSRRRQAPSEEIEKRLPEKLAS